MRDYTPEYESYRDDAVAIINGAAIAVAVLGVWTKPVFTGPIALVFAICGYFLSPKRAGRHDPRRLPDHRLRAARALGRRLLAVF